MKKLFKNFMPATISIIWISFLLLTGFTSCDGQRKNLGSPEATPAEASTVETAAPMPHFGHLVEVKTEHMNFILPDEIPSGWNTFRYHNKSSLSHFMLIDRMPVFEGEQKTYEDFKEIPPIFNDAMDLINAGNAEEGFAEFGRLPAWFSKVVFSGGVGIVSPGETAQTAVFLEPGTYVVECYVKTGGKFHPMSKQLIVNEESSPQSPPEPTINIALSRKGGIEMEEEPNAGLHTIAVHFKDQGPHEHFLGHDVHLVKLEEGTDIAALDAWMNWADPKGLNTPAPVTFLGGAQDMPAGNTAYVTVYLKPGNYAWVSEVPNPSSKGMLKTFTVPPVQGVALR